MEPLAGANTTIGVSSSPAFDGNSVSVFLETSRRHLLASGARLPCEIAMGDLPLPEAFPAEATDYVIHFFGLNCYVRWRNGQDAI